MVMETCSRWSRLDKCSLVLVILLLCLPQKVCAAVEWSDVAASVRKRLGRELIAAQACNNAPPSFADECRAVHKKMVSDTGQEAKDFDAMQDAFDNNKSKFWSLQVDIAEIELDLAKLSRKTWDAPGSLWTKKNGSKTSMMRTYTREIEAASTLRDGLCPNLEKQEVCRNDWDEYTKILQRVIDFAKARDADAGRSSINDYFDNWIGEEDAWVSAVKMQAILKPKYLGQ